MRGQEQVIGSNDYTLALSSVWEFAIGSFRAFCDKSDGIFTPNSETALAHAGAFGIGDEFK